MERLIKRTQKRAQSTHQKKDPSSYDDTLIQREHLDGETKAIFREMKANGKYSGGPSGHDD